MRSGSLLLALVLACTRDDTEVVAAPADEDAAECPPTEPPGLASLPSLPSPRIGEPDVDVVAANLRWIDTDVVLAASLELNAREVRATVDGGRARLDAVPDTSMVARLGLAAGDVVVAVDGAAANADHLRFLRDRLRGTRKVVLDLERAGAPLRLHYRVRADGDLVAPPFSRLLSLVELGIAAGEAGAATRVDRAVLATLRSLALAGSLGSSRAREIWSAFGVPKDAHVIAIDGESVAEDGADAAIAMLADRSKFELGIDADAAAGSSRTLRFEAVEGLVRADDLERAAAQVEAARLARIPGEGGGAASPAAPEFAESVVVESETRFTVDRAKLEALLADPANLARAARVVPKIVDGEARGFRLFGLRTGSPLKALGFANGDTLRSIDGVELRNIDDAMEVYTKLRRSKASKIVVGIERKGKELALEYRLR